MIFCLTASYRLLVTMGSVQLIPAATKGTTAGIELFSPAMVFKEAAGMRLWETGY